MDVKKLREIIAHDIALDPNDAIGIDECWQKMTGENVWQKSYQRNIGSRISNPSI